MPEQEEPSTTRPDATRPASHPVLADMGEAARVTGAADDFLSPTRQFNYPHMEESDWPRNLDAGETRDMLEHLAEIAGNVSGCINGIRCQHGVPDSAKPELDQVTGLLNEATRKLSELAEGKPAQEQQAGNTAQKASANFPRTTSALSAESGQPAATRSPARPAARPPRP